MQASRSGFYNFLGNYHVKDQVDPIQNALEARINHYEMLQILSVTIFERNPLWQVLTKTDYTALNPMLYNQLIYFD